MALYFFFEFHEGVWFGTMHACPSRPNFPVLSYNELHLTKINPIESAPPLFSNTVDV